MKNRNYVTPELTRRLEKLREECNALHLMAPPVSYVTLDVTEPDGSTWRHHEKTHSWVMNYYKLLGAFFLNATEANPSPTGGTYAPNTFDIKNLAGAVIAPPGNKTTFAGTNTVSNSTRMAIVNLLNGESLASGIIIGSSYDQSQGHEYYDLVGPITGVAISCSAPASLDLILPKYDPNTHLWTRTLFKTFVNNTQNTTFEINETGLTAHASILSYGGSLTLNELLMDRTVLADTVTLEPGAAVRVTYTISFAMPHID